MRGRDDLGLSGYDLLLYQTGEVTRLGVFIDTAVGDWIQFEQMAQGLEVDGHTLSFRKKVELAKRLLKTSPWTSDRRESIRLLFVDADELMKLRNSVVHDNWVLVLDEDTNNVQISYYASLSPHSQKPPRPVARDLQGGLPNEVWEKLRIDLTRVHARLSVLTFVRPAPDGSYFFPNVDSRFDIVNDRFDFLENGGLRSWPEGTSH